MLNNMNSGWVAWRKEEEYLDNLQRFNHKLDNENISSADKLIMMKVYASDSAQEYQLKAI